MNLLDTRLVVLVFLFFKSAHRQAQRVEESGPHCRFELHIPRNTVCAKASLTVEHMLEYEECVNGISLLHKTNPLKQNSTLRQDLESRYISVRC